MPTAQPEPERLIRIEEVAERLDLKRRTVADLARRGTIPRIRLSAKELRFKWSDVEKALAKLTLNPVK